MRHSDGFGLASSTASVVECTKSFGLRKGAEDGKYTCEFNVWNALEVVHDISVGSRANRTIFGLQESEGSAI
jgi:hypothetical protein